MWLKWYLSDMLIRARDWFLELIEDFEETQGDASGGEEEDDYSSR